MDSLEEEKHEDNLEEDIGIVNNWEAGIYTHKKYLISDEFHVFCDKFERWRRPDSKNVNLKSCGSVSNARNSGQEIHEADVIIENIVSEIKVQLKHDGNHQVICW